MKNFDLASMGVHEMSTLEMKETDGGIIWLLVVAGIVLLGASSCSGTTNTFVKIDADNSQEIKKNGSMAVDSTFYGN